MHGGEHRGPTETLGSLKQAPALAPLHHHRAEMPAWAFATGTGSTWCVLCTGAVLGERRTTQCS